MKKVASSQGQSDHIIINSHTQNLRYSWFVTGTTSKVVWTGLLDYWASGLTLISGRGSCLVQILSRSCIDFDHAHLAIHMISDPRLSCLKCIWLSLINILSCTQVTYKFNTPLKPMVQQLHVIDFSTPTSH